MFHPKNNAYKEMGRICIKWVKLFIGVTIKMVRQLHQTLDKRASRVSSLFELTHSVSKLITSPTLGLNNYVKGQRAKGRVISHFGLGESPFGAPPRVQEALKNNVNQTSYLPSEGILPLRQSIADYYHRYFDIKVSPDQIIVGPGSKELIFMAMTALNLPWIIPRPSWVSYVAQTRILGRSSFQPYSTHDQEYRITEKLLRKVFNELDGMTNYEQMIILLNYPNNPTGLTLKKDEVKRIARFARNNELLILSDEIYANITHSSFGQPHYSMLREYPEGTIVTGGASKDRSLGGWRLGVAILPETEPHLIRAFKAIGSETYSCVPAPIQYAGIEAYGNHPEIHKHIIDSTTIHEIIGGWVYEKLKNAGYEVPRPEGAFYLMPSLNHLKSELADIGIETSRDLSDYLLEHYYVAVLEGFAFGLPKEDLAFRIAYVDYDGQKALLNYRKDPDSARSDPELFVKTNAPSIHDGIHRLIEFIHEVR